jgi:multidrug efflux pump subunit AcrA (membrane-fusion protein)
MFIRAQIEFARHDNATLVPLAALVKRNGKQGVFIAEPAQGSNPPLIAREKAALVRTAENAKTTEEESRLKVSASSAHSAVKTARASFVPVTVGIISGELVEVLEPQISGSVVTMGNHLLEDGSNIMLPEKERPETTPQKSGDKSQAWPAGTKSGGSQ